MPKFIKKQTVILVVLITALLSCLGVALTSAKYSSQISGTATVQTAKFDVFVSGEPTNFSLNAYNDTGYFEFKVISNSEVALSYEVVLTLPTDVTLPDGVSFTLTVGETTLTPTSNANVYTFSNASVLAFSASGGTIEHTLTVKSNNFTSDVNIQGIKIDVVATQTQPNA